MYGISFTPTYLFFFKMNVTVSDSIPAYMDLQYLFLSPTRFTSKFGELVFMADSWFALGDGCFALGFLVCLRLTAPRSVNQCKYTRNTCR